MNDVVFLTLLAVGVFVVVGVVWWRVAERRAAHIDAVELPDDDGLEVAHDDANRAW